MITYVNGEFVPHEDAKISVDDRSIMLGDSVFDIARTFGGKPFKLGAHLERLRKSLNYVELDGDGLLPEIAEATDAIVARNATEIEAVGDVFIEQIVTRGLRTEASGDVHNSPTIIVKLLPISFPTFARYYERGVDLNVSLLTQPFYGAVDPRAKAGNRLALSRAEMKGERMGREGKSHWVVTFNADGTIAETNSTNLAITSGGTLLLTPLHEALGGISLQTLVELAVASGLEVIERRLTTYDVINADEVFLTATSFSLLPVVELDGIKLRNERRLFHKILSGWIELVDFDFVAQARERAGLIPDTEAAS